MLIVMDMSTGERLEESRGYTEEPQYYGEQPQAFLNLGLQTIEDISPARTYNEPREAAMRSFWLNRL